MWAPFILRKINNLHVNFSTWFTHFRQNNSKKRTKASVSADKALHLLNIYLSPTC